MENLKSEIIPNEMKVNIDEIMEKQLFNANRYYAESNSSISQLMQNELVQEPESFYKKLVSRWNWHNIYYENLLEPAYKNIVKDNDIELSPKEIEDLIRIYYTSCLVDEATLIMSGSIKKYLDYNCKNVNVTSEEISIADGFNMLITPPTETFFAQYQIDHLFYIYLLKSNNEEAKKQKEKIIKKYHANDEIVFKTRLAKKFNKKFDLTKSELLKEIKGYYIPEEYKVKHLYFTMEHSDRKAIRDIILYDNLTEKLIGSNLIGISGFLLRNKISEYLNNSKVLENNGYIYEFNKDTVIQALEQLKNERGIIMDKNVKPYKQRGDTCAIVCLMMALEYYEKMEKANWADERRLYKIYGSKYMAGTPFSAIAFNLAKKGLNTTIYHSEKEIFTNKNKVLSDTDFEFAMDEYKEHLEFAKNYGTKIKNGVDITSQLVKEELEKGNLVILAGELAGGYHAILVSGYDNDKFIVCDPLYRNKQIKTTRELESFMNTSIGKWFISVNNNTKEKDDLLNNLDNFNKEATDILETKKERKLQYEK